MFWLNLIHKQPTSVTLLADCAKNKLQKTLIFMDQSSTAPTTTSMPSYMENLFLRHPISCLKWWRPLRIQWKDSSKKLELKLLWFLKFYPWAAFCVIGLSFPRAIQIGKYRCHKSLNMFLKVHNDHLWQAIILELRLKYPDVHIIQSVHSCS